jgi:glycosyltransferase involved in cell wall biosynthesis
MVAHLEKLTLALTLLCENPRRLTGLSSLFRQFVTRSVRLDPALHWVVFAGPDYDFGEIPERVTMFRQFRGNDRLRSRLFADHFLVSETARRMNAKALLSVGFVPLRQSIPTIMHLFTLHHLDSSNRLDPLRSAYRRWATNRGLQRAHLIITNSRYASGRIMAKCPSIEGKLIQSYEGIDHLIFTPKHPPEEAGTLRKVLDIPPKYILWLSNLYPYKQADLLIGAYARLPAALQQEFPILFVGGDWSNQQASLQELATKLSVRGRLHFFGWVDQRWIAALLRQAKILVLPSREETFGRSVAEAMACGTPCVVHDIPIMREVTQGIAWITDFSNPAIAGESLIEALTNEPRRAEIIEQALARSQDFDFEKLTRERLKAIYNSLNLANRVKSLDQAFGYRD